MTSNDRKERGAKANWQEATRDEAMRAIANLPASGVILRQVQSCEGLNLRIETVFCNDKPIIEFRTRFGASAGACGKKITETVYVVKG